MSEISQKMGFDASAAIATLANLDKAMQAMNASVAAAPAGFTAFNTKAGKTVAALKHLSSNAKTAAADLQKIVSLQGKVAATPTPKQTPAGAKAAQPVKPPDLSPYIAQLQEMYKIAGAASKEQKRAFQSAITAAATYAQKHKKTADDIASTNEDMSQNMTGTANKMANALARISSKAKVSISAPDTSKYAAAIQKLIPLSKKATDAQKRNWLSMSTKIAEAALKSGMSIQQLIAIHGKLGTSLSGPANNIANAMQKMSTVGTRAINGMTVSWQTMMRVVATQAIVRALSTIRMGLRTAIGDAVKFQRAIAEIGTIGRELGGLDAIGTMVQRVSDQFNVGLANTAEAAYQTVSNQIASTEADVESFLGAAAKFSKVTKTDMATSVNLLSGVLNAFGKEVGETDDVAAKFFKTIELGRTRAEELAQGYGTVAPIADKLGISMEELNASVATLTINGIQTDKAFTQIRGTMQGFLKPTTAMKAAMKELGFATGEQVLQAYNLQDAIKAVTGTTEGNAAAIAKLFPRIRGLTGVLALVNDDADHFTRTLREQREALQETYDEAYKLVIETDAERITKDLNKLKNFFTVEFGQSVLEAGLKFTQAFGGVDTLLNIFKAIAPTLPPIAMGLGAVAAILAVVAANAALAKMNMALLSKASLVFVGIFASIAIGKAIAASIADGWLEGIESTKAALAKDLEARKSMIGSHISMEKTKIDRIVQLLAKGMAEKRKLYFQEVSSAQEANVEIIKDVKSATNEMISQRERVVAALQRQISTMASNVASSEKRVANLRDSLDDRLFKRKISRLTEERQVSELTLKSRKLAADAATKLSKATTEDQRNLADEEFRRANAFAEQALSIADGTDNLRLSKKAMFNLEGITKNVINAEKKYQKNIAASARALAARTLKEEKRVKAMKDKQEELLDAFSLTDKETGELLPESERREQVKKAQKLLREFVTLSGKPMDVSAMLNFAGVSAQLSNQLQSFQIEQLSVSEKALKAISDQVSRALNTSRIDDPTRVIAENLSGVEITGPQSEQLALETLREKYEALFETRKAYLEQGSEFHQAQLGLDASMKNMGEVLDTGVFSLANLHTSWDDLVKAGKAPITFKNLFSSIEDLAASQPDTSLDRYSKSLKRAIALSQKAAAQGGLGIHPDELDLAIKELGIAAEEAGAFGAAFGEITLNAGEALLATKKVVQARLDLKKSLGDQKASDVSTQLNRLDAAIKSLETPEQVAQGMSTSLSSANASIQAAVEPSSSLSMSWQSIGASAEIAAAAAVKLQQSRSTADTLPGTDDQANALNRAKIGADQLQLAMGGVKTNTDATKMAQDGHTTAVGGTQAAVNSLTASYGRLLTSIQAAAFAQSSLSSGAVTAAKGGPIGYFASGGRGTDTIPAMLSAGEFVTNAKSSRRFFSQLQAINAGRTPVYRESGGSTTNIGDVSISVTESSSPRQTGREVMQAFRREIRRGSGRI